MAILTPTPSADMEKGLPLEAASPSPPESFVAKKYDGLRGRAVRTMDFLVEHGVEERGTQPRPEDEREPLGWRSYVPQIALWAAMNTNMFTFSEGMVGVLRFHLDFKSCALVIIIFTFVMCIPASWLATHGPRTGMRQMVQARYSMGYYPTMIIGGANCLTFIGYLALQSILGGQCLSIASEADMTWTVGIVVVTVICVCVSRVFRGQVQASPRPAPLRPGQHAYPSSPSSASAPSTSSPSPPFRSSSWCTSSLSASTATSCTLRSTMPPRPRPRSRPGVSSATARPRSASLPRTPAWPVTL
jgi:hypothetical protein